ncbi:MAG: DUF1491 family protein [Alphaproteobacteria bacterium]
MDAQARLPTHLMIDACLNQLNGKGIFYYIVQRGDPNSGIILLKVNGLEKGCKLLIQQRDLDGVLGWHNALNDDFPPESEIDAYIERSKSRDPDLWVIEIEDRDMQNPFEV